MLSIANRATSIVILFSMTLGCAQAFAAPAIPAGAPPGKNRQMDSFKSSKTVSVMEKQVRIKREKVTLLKPGALQTFMIGLYEDNRLDKFIEMLKVLIDDEADSCPYCWSTFSRIQSSAVSVQQKAKKGYLKNNSGKKIKSRESKDKGESLDKSKNVKRREPHTQVVDAAQSLFAQVLETPEETGVKNALTILSDKLKEDENKTPGEHDYFTYLADAMYTPFLEDEAFEEDDQYKDDIF